MSKLEDSGKRLWANNFMLYTKAHGFHVNVIGDGFYKWHKLFQKVYEELQDEIDTLAEGLRTIREVVPFNLSRIQDLADIKDEDTAPEDDEMVKILYDDIETLIDNANEVFELCNDEKAYGLQNIVADYLQTVHKLCWMLDVSQVTPEIEKWEEKVGKPEDGPTQSY